MREKERKKKFEKEIKLELDKIFGPKRKKKKKKRLEGNEGGISDNQKEWKKLDLTLLSKEKISNRLAKMNVYFQTSGKFFYSKQDNKTKIKKTQFYTPNSLILINYYFFLVTQTPYPLKS